jgi:hypothetical protein
MSIKFTFVASNVINPKIITVVLRTTIKMVINNKNVVFFMCEMNLI